MVRRPGPRSIKGHRLKNTVHHFKSIIRGQIYNNNLKKPFNDTNDGGRCGVEGVNGVRGGHI